MIQYYQDENNWTINEINIFGKLYLTVTLFNLDEISALRDIVLTEFGNLDLSQSNSTGDIFQYVGVLRTLTKYHEFNADAIMNSYIDNVYFMSDVNIFKEFQQIFPSKYAEFILKENAKILLAIDHCIDEDFLQCR